MTRRFSDSRCWWKAPQFRSIERITGVHRDTILKLLVEAGKQCQAILDRNMHGVKANRLEFDEIWTFVRKKQKPIRQHDPEEYGDKFVFVAIDPETKLVPAFRIGRREHGTTFDFVSDVRERVTGRVQITTDGFRPYFASIDDAFGADVDYAYLVKTYGTTDPDRSTYSPSRITAIFHQEMFGAPDPALISTSIVERQNLTMRMAMRRFTRLNNAFSKKLENLKAAVALHFAWYNFVRVHSSLRVTPAMEAKLTDHVWTLGELLASS